MIERYVSWNDEMGDWELKCIAYTGNNMRKRDAIESTFDARKVCVSRDVYTHSIYRRDKCDLTMSIDRISTRRAHVSMRTTMRRRRHGIRRD